MKTLPSFSPTMLKKSTVSRFMVTTTTARRPLIWAGVSPMPGCPWPVTATRVSPMASRLTNGVSLWIKMAVRSVRVFAAAATPTVPQPSTRFANILNGWISTLLRVPAALDFYTYLPYLAKGNVAQQIFWYTAFVPDMVAPGPTVNADGTPKWRMAPSPHGAYWKDGMKLGYQDCGSWTFFKSTPVGTPQGRLALCAILRVPRPRR